MRLRVIPVWPVTIARGEVIHISKPYTVLYCHILQYDSKARSRCGFIHFIFAQVYIVNIVFREKASSSSAYELYAFFVFFASFILFSVNRKSECKVYLFRLFSVYIWNSCLSITLYVIAVSKRVDNCIYFVIFLPSNCCNLRLCVI